MIYFFDPLEKDSEKYEKVQKVMKSKFGVFLMH